MKNEVCERFLLKSKWVLFRQKWYLRYLCADRETRTPTFFLGVYEKLLI